MSDLSQGLTTGSRVAVRSRIDPPPQAGPRLTDTVGELIALDADSLVIRTRTGDVTLRRDLVTAAKVIPPRPVRRGAPHRAVGIDDLERAMVNAHPPLARAPLGGWLLRAADGFTARANSALPVGDPGLPLSDAVSAVQSWYRERGLRPAVMLPLPAGGAVGDDPLGALLLGQGWEVAPRVHVLTADSRSALAAVAGHASPVQEWPVRRLEGISDAWLDVAELSRPVQPRSAAVAVLGGPSDQLVLAVEDAGAIVAVARAPHHDAMTGLYSVATVPTHRRRGLARALTAHVAADADRRGVRILHLQAEATNAPALALYRSLGFEVHHDYVHLGEGATG
ncbi:GNAT family N-acetyltransferase [Janibacter sp. G1551]|uniref:GNAT family N-acetyltransferase n=1 Tax=Janibacter sp. G1551 TaxID=3420440 RepID=UPI003CFC81B5